MVKNNLVLRSSISHLLLKRMLFRGCILASVGTFTLLLTSITIPSEILQKWGGWIFMISFVLIIKGLLPYKRLYQIQMNPFELILDDFNCLSFYMKGKKILSLSSSSLLKINYIDHKKFYGIAIWLKPSSLVIYHSYKEVERLREKGYQIGKADLFFPYFNQRSYNELLDWQQGEKQE